MYSRTTNCTTCEARGKKCDGTRTPTGCRRCVQAGIECGGYQAKATRPKAKSHGHRSEPNATKTCQTAPGIINPNEITALVLAPGTSSAPDLTSQPRDTDFVTSAGWSSSHKTPARHYTKPCPQTYSSQTWNPTSLEDIPGPPIGNATSAFILLPLGDHGQPSTSSVGKDTHPMEDNTRTYASGSTTADLQFNLVGASIPRSALRRSDDRIEHKIDIKGGKLHKQRQGPLLYPGPGHNWLGTLETDECDEPETLRGELTKMLTPDRRVHSNTLPFVIQAFTSWTRLFVFEPVRLTKIIRDAILRRQLSGEAVQRRLLLIAGAVWTISRSTRYDLNDFMDLYTDVVGGVRAARTALEQGQLTREAAVDTMGTFHDLFAIMFKVGSLTYVLNTMNMCAPIFRRACPESSGELTNLSRILSAPDEIHIKMFASFDIIQSIITGRPMFFRYNLDFISPEVEKLMDADDGPGLRWAYGVPDRLIYVMAKMNTLHEDGTQLSPELVRALDDDIRRCSPVISSTSVTDPVIMLGRITVQEAWRHAAQIYLHMGLCGVDSSHEEVVRVQSKFMLLFRGTEARRNPDSFLILPLILLGVATSRPEDRYDIAARLWAVAECKKQGTTGNDIARMLNDIWTRTTERPAVWADIRTACLRVVGM
ncbi:unnamed protein product [Rhizoctonia solani]|uniref:Zn(2)-C6 fungal-type domain-containing protein n=1 Tax=Rhizoctonia solani TaxID=456999 RepID=A0A8H2XV88_9AGAM|nr:unnamed protein product [Rhizoctonia solani]